MDPQAILLHHQAGGLNQDLPQPGDEPHIPLPHLAGGDGQDQDLLQPGDEPHIPLPHLAGGDGQDHDLVQPGDESHVPLPHLAGGDGQDHDLLQPGDEPHILLPHQTGSNDVTMCVICIEEKATHAIVACGHLCLCLYCANTYRANRLVESGCPICREPVILIMQIHCV